MKKYRWKQYCCIKADADAAGEMLDALERENKLTAKNLVDANREEGTPLHDEFEWDDAVAAESYREEQARHIIRSLTVVVDEQDPVRAYFNIVHNEPEYHHIETILRSPDSTDALLKTALGELLAFERKYSQLTQLAGVFRAIHEVEA